MAQILTQSKSQKKRFRPHPTIIEFSKTFDSVASGILISISLLVTEGTSWSTIDSAALAKGSNAMGWAKTCAAFTLGVEAMHDGVEEEDDDADIDVKDVEHDDAFFKELEFEEFGGESDGMLFVFRQDVRVIKVWDVVRFSSFSGISPLTIFISFVV